MNFFRKFCDVDIINFVILKINKVDISKTLRRDRLLIFQRENFQTSFPAEVTISEINFDPDSTPIDSYIPLSHFCKYPGPD
jgi:hypothetical protein